MPGNFISVGSLVKKLLAINPSFSPHDLMYIIRHSTHFLPANDSRGEREVLDEAKAIAWAKSTLRKN